MDASGAMVRLPFEDGSTTHVPLPPVDVGVGETETVYVAGFSAVFGADSAGSSE